MMECDFAKAEGLYTRDMAENRTEEMRLSLYRAIYAGDMDEAENIANLMGMVGIDRDIVWQARQEVRLHV